MATHRMGRSIRRVADNLRRIQSAHGRDAVATYLGNPTVQLWRDVVRSRIHSQPAHTQSLRLLQLINWHHLAVISCSGTAAAPIPH
jgi:hypothetical protein